MGPCPGKEDPRADGARGQQWTQVWRLGSAREAGSPASSGSQDTGAWGRGAAEEPGAGVKGRRPRQERMPQEKQARS